MNRSDSQSLPHTFHSVVSLVQKLTTNSSASPTWFCTSPRISLQARGLRYLPNFVQAKSAVDPTTQGSFSTQSLLGCLPLKPRPTLHPGPPLHIAVASTPGPSLSLVQGHSSPWADLWPLHDQVAMGWSFLPHFLNSHYVFIKPVGILFYFFHLPANPLPISVCSVSVGLCLFCFVHPFVLSHFRFHIEVMVCVFL